MATTFTIVAVFIPVAFMGGMVGQFFYAVRHHGRGGGARVAVRQLHARPDAVVALVRPGRRGASASAGSSAAMLQRFNKRFDRLHGSYERTLAWSLRHRWVVVAVAVVAFVSAFPILGMLGGDFMPDFNRGEYQISFKATPGATLRETGERAQEMVAKLRELPGRRVHLHDHRRSGLAVSGPSPKARPT